MTIEELAQGLNEIFPTRFSHFASKQEPPFICYLDVDYDNMIADNKVIAEVIDIDIELYTRIKDYEAEKKIKDFLNANDLPFNQSPTLFIEDDNVFQSVLNIRLINKF